jgi:hypothetical protein
MEEQYSKNDALVLRRVARRSVLGAFIGLVIGMIWNPPFKGITTTPNDVQGLIFFSWFMLSGVGMILGVFAGLFGRNMKQEPKELSRTEQTNSNLS